MRYAAPTLILGLLSLVAFAILGAARNNWDRSWGDEGTFRAMAVSMAEDGDLEFHDEDAERLEALSDPGARAVIIQTANGRVAYSKPPLYALAAAPFVRLAGIRGLWIANAVVLLLAALIAWAVLRRSLGGGPAGYLVTTFLGASVLPAYIVWEMSEVFQLSLALAGLALCSLALPREPHPDAVRGSRRTTSPEMALFGVVAGGLLLGLLTSARFPNALIILGPGLALLLRKRFRELWSLATGVAAGFLVASLLGWALQGTWNPYKAQRTTYTGSDGYATKARDVTLSFYQAPARQSMGLIPKLDTKVSAYSSLYFLVGRHSGLLWYFPPALLLALIALRQPDRETLALLLATAAVALFYLLWWPTNYFGGSTFLGNRYFLTAYPLLLFAAARSRKWHSLLSGAWVIAGIVFVSALFGVSRASDFNDRGSQSHTLAGVFRVLPYESTARTIEGRQDRYWSGDFLRFIDPFAVPLERGFTVTSQQPPAQVLAATYQDLSELVLRVKPTGAATLVIDGGSNVHRFDVGLDDSPYQIIRVPLDPTWRDHRFWFQAEPFESRLFRFSLETTPERETSSPAPSVTIEYGSGVERLDQLFARKALSQRLPESVEAGSTAAFAASVRNTSRFRWKPQDPFPVTLSYRLYNSQGERVIEGERRLPQDVIEPSWLVASGRAEPEADRFHATFEATWPTTPGSYRLVVDLVIDDYGWFEDRLGEPVAQTTVEVTASGSVTPEATDRRAPADDPARTAP